MAHLLYAEDYANTFPSHTLNTTDNSRAGASHYALMGNPDGLAANPSHQIMNSYSVHNSQVHRCPSDQGQGTQIMWGTSFPSIFEFFGTSYSYNAGGKRLGAWTLPGTPVALPWTMQGCWGRNIDTISQPARQVLITDHTWRWGKAEEWNGWWDNAFFLFHHLTDPVMNMTFVDGHATLLKMHNTPNHWTNEDYDFVTP